MITYCYETKGKEFYKFVGQQCQMQDKVLRMRKRTKREKMQFKLAIRRSFIFKKVTSVE